MKTRIFVELSNDSYGEWSTAQVDNLPIMGAVLNTGQENDKTLLLRFHGEYVGREKIVAALETIARDLRAQLEKGMP